MTQNLRTLDAESLAKIIRNIRLVAFDFDGVSLTTRSSFFKTGAKPSDVCAVTGWESGS